MDEASMTVFRLLAELASESNASSSVEVNVLECIFITYCRQFTMSLLC